MADPHASPVSRRSFAATLAAGAAGAAAIAGDDTRDRDPLTAPKPPEQADLPARAELLFDALLAQFPETRVAEKRAEITRGLYANLYYGAVLANAGLANADGPGPLWRAFRGEDGS